MAVNSKTHAEKLAALKADAPRARKPKAKPVEVPVFEEDESELVGLEGATIDEPEDDDDDLDTTQTVPTVPDQTPTAPIRYSLKLAVDICKQIALNQPLQAICAKPGMPTVTQVQAWLLKFPQFMELHEKARALQGDYIADEMLMIVHELRTTTTPGRAGALRAAADLLAKQAEWRSPRKYGPKMDLTMNERPKTPDEIKAEIARLRLELGVPDGRIARIK